MTSIPWTDPRVETLKSLWLAGWSAAQVAAALGGVSRNAVIGKLHRLGLGGRATASSPPPRRSARRAALRQGPERHPADRRTQRPSPQDQRKSTEPPVELAPLAPDLTGLAPHACRWPIGDPAAPDFGFCGRACERQPYCPSHARRAFRAGEPLDRRGLMRLIADFG